jgi:hypothetical protein
MFGFPKTAVIIGILFIGMVLAVPAWAGGHHGGYGCGRGDGYGHHGYSHGYGNGHGYNHHGYGHGGYHHGDDDYGPGYGYGGSYTSWDFYAGGQDAGGYFGLGWSAGFREDYGASGYRTRVRSGYGGGPYYPRR